MRILSALQRDSVPDQGDVETHGKRLMCRLAAWSSPAASWMSQLSLSQASKSGLQIWTPISHTLTPVQRVTAHPQPQP